MQAEHYGSKNLKRYLEDIIIKSPENTDRIIELFHDMGLYEMAESALKQKKDIERNDNVIHLLTKYDPDNIIGWLWDWETSFAFKDDSTGKNIIRLAADSEKAEYEKEVYSYFADHGPRCNAYKEYLTAIPPDYIRENKFIQDTLLTQITALMNSNENEKIEYIKSLLPSERLADIVTPIPTYTQSKGGCYIATCVYGSYNCPQVWTLRRFRDYTLSTTWYGRVFINCYYAVSPTLVKWFGEKKWFQIFWKKKLDLMVAKLNNKGVENTQYQDKY